MRRTLAYILGAIVALAAPALPARAQLPSLGTVNTQPVFCAGEPWYDARCQGAVGDNVTDDTVTLKNAFDVAQTHSWKFHLPRKTFKVSGTVVWAVNPLSQFSVDSDSGTINASGYAGGPGLQIVCGEPGDNAQCVYFKITGNLYVNSAATANPAFQFGYGDLSDSFVHAKVDQIIATNSSTGGACALHNVSGSQLGLSCVSQNAAGVGLALQRSMDNFFPSPTLSSPGQALLMYGSTNSGNVFSSPNLTGGGTCIAIASFSSRNLFSGPNLAVPNCLSGGAVNATLGVANTIISPNYTGALGSNLVGITVLNDPVAGTLASIPGGMVGLPQVAVGGVAGVLPVSQVDLAPIAAPAAPTTGWRLYVDGADGRWKAKSSTGATRLMGVP